jgi:hypothetical protein
MALIAITITVRPISFWVARHRQSVLLTSNVRVSPPSRETRRFVTSSMVTHSFVVPHVRTSTSSTTASVTPEDDRTQSIIQSTALVHESVAPLFPRTRREVQFVGKSKRRTPIRPQQSQGSAVPGGFSPLQKNDERRSGMLSRNRTIVHSLDATDRPSTGITRLPLIPVDGDTSKPTVDGRRRAALRRNVVDQSAEQPMTSLELLRQLEAFVRELFEISTSE